MDALNLTGAEVVARLSAIARLQVVAQEMTACAERLSANLGTPTLAIGSLAMAARAGWTYAQVALIQADAGVVSSSMIGAIAKRDPDTRTPNLRRLALSTLSATERRLAEGRRVDCQREALS